MDTIVDLTATELRRQLGTRQLAARDLMQACIQRIEDRNPEINAVVAADYEGATEQAIAADELAASGQPLPPLHGLPVLVKDLTNTAGMRTTYGSRCFADHVPHRDAVIVSSLRRDGAIVLGKTNTPEFGAGANTVNEVYGATRNPHDLRLTAGGSSGGSAAALAVGMAPLATGSDLGGSLRIPASFCGVVGMRPTAGVVPSADDSDGFSPLWTDGPMARSVADVALVLASMAGFDRRDPLATPFERRWVLDPVDLSALRVAVSSDLGLGAVDAPIVKIFEDRIDLLRGHLGSVETPHLDLGAADRIFRVLRAEALAVAFGELAAERGDLLGENVRANLLEGQQFTLADTAACRRDHTVLFRQFQTLFDAHDVLIVPATGVSPFPVEDGHPVAINDRPLDGYYAWYAVTWALSLTGCPVVTVPCGLDHRGMPFGVQLVGPRHGDAALLAIAEAFERLLHGVGLRPPTVFH